MNVGGQVGGGLSVAPYWQHDGQSVEADQGTRVFLPARRPCFDLTLLLSLRTDPMHVDQIQAETSDAGDETV